MIHWSRAENETFKLFVRFMMNAMLEHSQGNPFAQGLTDGCTLENGMKYLAHGMQFVPNSSFKNMAITLGMHRVEDNSNEAAANLMNGTSKNVTGHDCESLCHSTTADRAVMIVILVECMILTRWPNLPLVILCAQRTRCRSIHFQKAKQSSTKLTKWQPTSVMEMAV